MQDRILQIVAEYGYWGILVLIALENVFPPIPSEVILTFGGVMAALTPMNLFGVVTAATAGSLLGAAVLYIIGRVLGSAGVEALILRRGKALRIQKRDLDRVLTAFARYQGRAVFLCRMAPLLRSLISIPAGIARMPLAPFLLLTALGSTVWNAVLVCAGALLGGQHDRILRFFSMYAAATAAVLAIVTVTGAGILVRRRIKARDPVSK